MPDETMHGWARDVALAFAHREFRTASLMESFTRPENAEIRAQVMKVVEELQPSSSENRRSALRFAACDGSRRSRQSWGQGWDFMCGLLEAASVAIDRPSGASRVASPCKHRSLNARSTIAMAPAKANAVAHVIQEAHDARGDAWDGRAARLVVWHRPRRDARRGPLRVLDAACHARIALARINEHPTSALAENLKRGNNS